MFWFRVTYCLSPGGKKTFKIKSALVIFWFWLCEQISYPTPLLCYFMDHPTCDLYINFLGIQARSQACLYTEKIQVILEINHDIGLKSIIFVLILNEHVMQIKQSSEELIYRTDFNIQRARWRVFKYFSWSISLQKKQIISIKCCIRLKKFLHRDHLGKFNQ